MQKFDFLFQLFFIFDALKMARIALLSAGLVITKFYFNTMRINSKNCFCFFLLSTFTILSACNSGRTASGSGSDSSKLQRAANETASGRPNSERPIFKTDLTDDQSVLVKSSNELCNYEVELSQAAQTISVNTATRKIAQNIITADMASIAALSPIYTKHNLLLSSNLGPEHQKTLTEISKLKGSAFDEKYLGIIAKSRKELIKNCKSAQTKLAAADAKIFSDEILPKTESSLTAEK